MGIEPAVKRYIDKKYNGQKAAVYGLGVETERLLTKTDGEAGWGLRIIGLLDSYRQDGVFYGKPVITLEEAVAQQVKLIIVAARPGSCRAIAKRIGNVCLENAIDLIDIRGRNLCRPDRIAFDFKGIQGMSRQELKKIMMKHSVISVDLFDTLIMRRVLSSSDVVELTSCKLKEWGIFIEDFCEMRLCCEKELARNGAPVLSDIYTYMEKKVSLQGVSPQWLAEVEWETDYELLISRREMCELLEEVKECGKEIYIITDTYYTRTQLNKILEKCSISFYTDILLSCEYKTGKTQQLFQRLKERTREKSCVHIGDDIFADIEMAKENGILPCQIYSGGDLFEMAGYFGMRSNLGCISERLKAGMLVSRIFNSPFQFETEERKITVDNTYDVGFLFLAPVISDFVLWFDRQVESRHLENIWFCARDGYLIKKLYDELRPGNPSIYFLISRTAAVAAGVEVEEDIRYVEDMKFGGTLKKQLKERFGVTVDETEGKDLMCYSEEILKETAANREGYRAYINSLDIREGGIAFFDFVAKGTSQMYLERLLEYALMNKAHPPCKGAALSDVVRSPQRGMRHGMSLGSGCMEGFYFMQLEPEYMKKKGLTIFSFYRERDSEGRGIYDDYYILETIMTSPQPSLKKFDSYGVPCYADEMRTIAEIECIQKIQESILDYFRIYLRICPKSERTENKKMDEKILALIHGVQITDQRFIGLKVEDLFFNRITDVTALL